MKILSRIHNIFARPRVKVEITCPHGEFIPGAYTPGGVPRWFGCRECGMKVRLSTFHGLVTW